ncbi:MAG: hypothetical protein KatS3mg052_0801 [Candidatus Roseilinea sp.]|nr:MAG: hypothetical protein KatS3mg052_0801 [Candidatus Roseilinea sp.]
MPRPKKYVVELTDEQRASLLDLLTPTSAAFGGGQDRPVDRRRPRVNPKTVRNIRKRFAEEGLEAALQERPRPGARPKPDGKQEAFLIALACSKPPERREHWTMQLPANRSAALGIVASLSDETARRVLKNDLKPW